MAKELCALLEKNLQLLYQNNTAHVLNSYNERLYKIDEQASFKQNGTAFTGIVKTVTEDGRLIISGEKEKAFLSGEVEWVL